MYLLYLDDSGSAANRSERHLVLAGVSVFERRAFFLANELEAVATRFDAAHPEAVEFHASEMFGGRSSPWKGLSRPDRATAIKAVLEVLSNDGYGTYAFAVAEHKDSYPHQDPMEVAFEEMCRRFDLQLSALNNQPDAREAQRGMLILDESAYETTLQDMARNFRSIGTRWGLIRNLAEVPRFVNSNPDYSRKMSSPRRHGDTELVHCRQRSRHSGVRLHQVIGAGDVSVRRTVVPFRPLSIEPTHCRVPTSVAPSVSPCLRGE